MPSAHRVNERMERGFSLLELMIVVAIVGILAAIAFTVYSAQVKRRGAPMRAPRCWILPDEKSAI